MLEQKAHRPGRDGRVHIRVITVRGEHEHLGGGERAENLPGRFQTIEMRHGDIHQHHGGPEFLGQRHRLPSVLRFADDFDVGFQFEHLAKSLTHDHVVFGKENSNFFHKWMAAASGRRKIFRFIKT